jgi:hypothetical protein
MDFFFFYFYTVSKMRIVSLNLRYHQIPIWIVKSALESLYRSVGIVRSRTQTMEFSFF